MSSARPSTWRTALWDVSHSTSDTLVLAFIDKEDNNAATSSTTTICRALSLLRHNVHLCVSPCHISFSDSLRRRPAVSCLFFPDFPSTLGHALALAYTDPQNLNAATDFHFMFGGETSDGITNELWELRPQAGVQLAVIEDCPSYVDLRPLHGVSVLCSLL